MKNLVLVFALFFSMPSIAQIESGLNPEERAYLFHIVKKSPILDTAIGRYFEYIGPDIKFPNGALNFDSIETVIIQNPDFLLIRDKEIAKSTKGILLEASNKMALWELNRMLLYKRSETVDFEKYRSRYERFEQILLEKLPTDYSTSENGNYHPISKFHQVLNPSLSFDDKIALLESFRGGDINNQLAAIQAVAYAVNGYVQERTLQIARLLGGEIKVFKNVLTAAGDGSLTSGLLEEREKDELGRWNKGLPKAIGLFPYEAVITPATKTQKAKINPLPATVHGQYLVGNNMETALHFDVWGYNSQKQTTVVIEKNGLSYHLFGSGSTRFLSPDSTFSEGKTFQAIINELEFDKLAKLNEMVYGPKGFDYWIDWNKKMKDETELKIEKNEKKYSDFGYAPITTSPKASRKVKKAKKRAQKANAGADTQVLNPTTYAGKKQKGKKQNDIVFLYAEYEGYKANIKQLEKERQEAIDLMAIYQRRLDRYKDLMGRNWATFTEKDGLYLFQDSSTFDIMTQEFTFPASVDSAYFEVKLLAIPDHCLSDQADEVMLHFSMTDALPNYDARIQIKLEDQFASNAWSLNNQLLHESDSLSVLQFFEALKDGKNSFDIIARGAGVGKWNGAQVVKDSHPIETDSYPGATQDERNRYRESASFSVLRMSEVKIDLNRGIVLEVNSFTDPVRSKLTTVPEALNAVKTSYKLSDNDLLSVLRTATVLQQLTSELNVLAGKYLSREDAKLVVDRLNKQVAKTRISVGATSVRLSEL